MHHLSRRTPKDQPRSTLNITEQTARFALLRLISIQLDAAGFTHVDHRSVMEDLEALISGLMDGIVHVAYEMAQLCRRSRPNVRDMIAACADQGIEIQHLNEILSFNSPHDLKFEIPVARSTNPGDPTVDFLPSDPESDEGDSNQDITTKDKYDSIIMRSTPKRQKPNSEKIGGLPYLPSLPPRHTWRHTTLKPAPATVLPPEHLSRSSTRPLPIPNLLHPEFLQTDENDPNTPACLGFLNQRIRDARMVEKSLTHLVQPHTFHSTTKSPIFSKVQHRNGSDGPSDKYHLSENDVPIINFERDWYLHHVHPSNSKK